MKKKNWKKSIERAQHDLPSNAKASSRNINSKNKERKKKTTSTKNKYIKKVY